MLIKKKEKLPNTPTSLSATKKNKKKIKGGKGGQKVEKRWHVLSSFPPCHSRKRRKEKEKRTCFPHRSSLIITYQKLLLHTHRFPLLLFFTPRARRRLRTQIGKPFRQQPQPRHNHLRRNPHNLFYYTVVPSQPLIFHIPPPTGLPSSAFLPSTHTNLRRYRQYSHEA